MRYVSFPLAPLAILLTLGLVAVPAQTSNEFFNTSMGGVSSGPIASSQTAQLLLNSDNPAGDAIGATSVDVRVTATLSNQQYTGVGTGTGSPVVMFGGTNTSGSGGPGSVPAFDAMNAAGTPSNGLFSNTPSGTAQGINVAVNRAFGLYTSIRHWGAGGGPATTSRVHMADLTLTFSSPVSNPRLHFVGMGGTTGSLGFGSEFTLTTPGLTFTKVAGNAAFVVSATQVNNGSAAIDASCGGSAGCGTVTVNGTNITTITLQVYVRGDGAGAAWGGTTSHSGDRFLLGVSLPESYSVTGSVVHDTDGAGSINGAGIGAPGGTQLYANLVDPTDNSVVGSVAVNPDGTFSFPGTPAGGVNYRVEISTIAGVPLSPAPVRVLPSGWGSVGEHLGGGSGNDGTADRVVSVTVGSAAPLAANFGITSGTTAADVNIGGRVTTADGRGIRNVTVTLTTADGTVMTALTGNFGYYSFRGVPGGQSAIVMVRGKRFTFANPVLLVSTNDNFANVDFVASE